MATDTTINPGQAPDLTAEVLTPETPDKTNYTLKELFELDTDETPCLYAPIFIKSGIAVLVGGSDSGKSSLLRQMAMCVATGRNFLGWEYQGDRNKAIYFSSEDDQTLTARVVKKYNRTMGVSPECAENLRFVFEVVPETLPDTLEDMLNQEPADLVVIDALADAFNGKSLNDNREIRAFYSRFKEIAKRFNCLIIFNHHTGKRTGFNTPDKDNTLGSQAIEAAPRLAIELRPDPEKSTIKHFCVTKCNYLPSEFKTKSFALAMDENLVFEPTGEQKDFADLAKKTGTQEQKPKNPRKIADEEHKNFIRGLFQQATNGKLDLKTIKENIEISFDVSDRTARTFITWYKNKSWIEFAERGSRRTEFYKSNVLG